MGAYTVKRIDDMAGIHDGFVKLAGAELAVESFGLQVLDFPPAFAHYPAHDHAEDGQEEVYVVLAGSLVAELDGDRVELAAGSMLRVPAGTMRRLEPGSDGARVVALGGTPGRPYERPEAFRIAAAR